jgi:hypothetical protein
LEINVAPGKSADSAQVVLLIDGRDLLAWRGNQGFGPEELLHTGNPLIPTDPPRRVALYLCACGVPGCGTIACVISESAGVVHWSRFRDFVGVNHPLDMSIPDDAGRPVGLPDLAFDAAQYAAEVERATTDRSWETRRLRIVRLLKERLAERPERWQQLGIEFRSLWLWDEENEIFAVNLRRAGDQLLIGVRAPQAVDEDTAVNAMAAEVLGGDERKWSVIYDQRQPSLPADPP